jgi:broad specificity phosphatase PhoE
MGVNATITSTERCTLILVRHAHTDMAGRFCGHSDPPLSAEGLTQLPALKDDLADRHFTQIFSSDLLRTRRTAESIAEARQLQVDVQSSLREFAFGSWEGKTWDQVVALDPEYAQRWLDLYPSVPAPGGEHFNDFLARIHGAMTAIANQMQDGCALVVTHAGVIRTFLSDVATLRNTPSDFSKCDYVSCWEVWREKGQWILPAQTPAAIGVK